MPASDWARGVRDLIGDRFEIVTATARSVAVEIVRRVTDEDAYSTRVLPALLERSRLARATGASRRSSRWGRSATSPDSIARSGSGRSRPVARMSPGARAALRLGAYQLLFMRIPSHAAVSASVDLATPRERGFVNAILRRSSRRTHRRRRRASTDDDISTRTGLAPWAVQRAPTAPRRRRGRGGGRGVRRAWAPLPPHEHVLDVGRCVRARAPRERRTPRDRRSCIRTACSSTAGDPARLRGFAQGWFAVQDQASAFVGRRSGPATGRPCARRLRGSRRQERRTSPAWSARSGRVRRRGRPPRARGPRAFARRTAGCRGARRRPGRHAIRRSTARSTGCSWTRRARGSDRRGGARSCCGVRAEPISRRSRGSRWRSPRRPPIASDPVAVSSTRCARSRARRRMRRVTHSSAIGPSSSPTPIDGPDGPSPRVRLWPHRHGSDGMFIAAFRKRP